MAFVRRRRWIAATVLVIVGLLVLAALAHTPMARQAVLGLALRTVERNLGIEADVDRFTINWFTLNAELHGLTARSAGADDPFFTAERVRADLPWSIALGRVGLDSVEIDNPHIRIVRTEDGWNLPASNSEEPSTPADNQDSPIPPIGRVAVRSLAIVVDDRVNDLGVEGAAIHFDAEGVGGGPLRATFTAAEPVRLSWGDQATTINELEAALTVDDSGMGLDRLVIRMPEAHVEVDGRVEAPWGALALDLDVDVEIDTGRVGTLAGLDTPLSGQLDLAGNVTGGIDTLRVSLDVKSERLAWSTLQVAELESSMAYTANAIDVSSLSLRVAGGEIAAHGRLGLGPDAGDSSLTADWQGLDLASLVAAVAPDELPVSGSAALDGELAAVWQGFDLRGAIADIELRNRPAVSTDGRVPIEGAASLQLAHHVWSLQLDQLSAMGLRFDGQLNGVLPDTPQPINDGSVSGNLIVDATDLALVADRADDTGLVEGLRQQQLEGRARVTAEVSGRVLAPTVAGTLEGRDVFWRGVGPTTLDLVLRVDPDRLQLADARLELGGDRVVGRGSVTWATGALDGALTLDLATLARFAPAMPATLAPDGALTGTATVGGTVDAPLVDADLEAAPLTLGGLFIDRAKTRVSLADDVLTVTELRVDQGGGMLTVNGRYHLTDQEYVAEAEGDGLQLAQLFGDLVSDDATVGGVIAVSFTGSGTLSQPNGSGQVRIDELVIADRRLGEVTADLQLADGDATATVAAPALGTLVAGTLALTGGQAFEVTGDIQGLELSRLQVPRDDVPTLTGVLTAEVRSFGRLDDLSGTALDLNLRQLAGQLGEAPFRLTEPMTVRYRDGAVATPAASLLVGDSRLSVNGNIGWDTPGQLDLALSGDLGDLIELTRLVGADVLPTEPLTMSGAFEAQAQAVGTLSAVELSGGLSLTNASIAVAGHPPVTELEVRASYADAAINLDRLEARWQGIEIDGSGQLPLTAVLDELPAALGPPHPGPFSLAVALADITPEALVGYVDNATLADLGGALAVRLEIEGDALRLDALRATLVVPEGAVSVAGIPLRQRRESRIELADGRLRVTAFDWGNDQDYLTVGGSFDLVGERPVDLTVTAELDLRALSAFLPNVATEGDALAIANLQGSLEDPTVSGTIELTGVGLRIAEPRLVISDMNGALFLNRDTVQLYELAGEANGGSLALRGTLQMSGLEPEGEVTLAGRGIALEIPEGLRTEVDTDLTLTLAAGEPTLAGTVTVLRGAYREPLTLTGGLLAALQQQESVSVVGIEEPSPLEAVALNIRTVTAEEIVIDNNYADATVGFDVRVVGTLAAPGLTGRASLGDGGELRLGNRVYQIETGVVDFIDPAGIQPELNIEARTRVSGNEITVTITGVPAELDTAFQSDTGHSESDIVSLLLTGRTLDEVGVAPGEAARDQALGLVSGEVLGTAGRAVGLDTVRLEQEVSPGGIRFDSSLVASETDPGNRLTVGKNLSDQVQLIVSQNLRESGLLTWIVEYLPRRNIQIRSVVDDENDPSLEFRHAVSFGNPPRQAIAATPPREEVEVRAVEITGTPGFPETELRRRLRLDEGRQFDFYRWQQDRDALEELYVDRGYLEARIRSQRLEQPDGSLTLSYRIDRGPLAVLTVDGFELPGDVRDQMLDAWHRAVFDGFLLDEVRTIAREHLVSEGYLRSTVEATIRETDDTRKEVALRIDSGPQIVERRLAFRGNDRLSAERLEAFVTQQGLDESVWADPDPLAAALVALYQSEGMLETEVTVGQPTFVDTTATLPIQIAEGPVFEIAELTIEGVETLSVELIDSLIRPEPGDVYIGSEISDARIRVDRAYRQTGFNGVRVSVRSTVDRERDTVSVAFEIREGQRQIVEEIEIVGRGRTRPGLVSRALQIAPGQPVDLGAWNRARKRLYDSGAFRSVDITAEPLEGDAFQTRPGEQPVRARVLLEEWPAYRLRYGLQVKNEEAPLAEASSRENTLGLVGDLSHQNFIGRGITLGSAFRWDTDRQIIRGFGRVPTFFGLPITSNVFAGRELGNKDPLLDGEFTQLTLEQRLQPRPALTIAYSYNFERTHVFPKDLDPNDPLGFDVTQNIARLNSTAVVDTRNDVFNATIGWFHASTVEYGLESLGSDLQFVKYSGQQFHYWPIGGDVVLASAVRVGLGQGIGVDKELIPTERFFTGGGNTVRGYSQDSLGPVDSFLDVEFGLPDPESGITQFDVIAPGGNASLVLNQEIRFPVYGIVKGVGFIDAGNVFSRVSDVSLTELKVGVGFGVRVDTPFGLFRFDVAKPLSDTPFREAVSELLAFDPLLQTDDTGKARFYFSIGQVF